MESEYTVLNSQVDYLLTCRSKNQRDLGRNLRKLMRLLIARKRIPLDEKMYPDRLRESTNVMEPYILSILDYLENRGSTTSYIQLSLPFNEDG